MLKEIYCNCPIYKNISFFLFNNNNYFLQKQDDFLIDLQPFSTKLVRMYNYIELFIFSLLLLDFLNKKNCFQISLLYKSSSVFHIGKPELGATTFCTSALPQNIVTLSRECPALTKVGTGFRASG